MQEELLRRVARVEKWIAGGCNSWGVPEQDIQNIIEAVRHRPASPEGNLPERLGYLATVVRVHADKFPIPSHMLAHADEADRAARVLIFNDAKLLEMTRCADQLERAMILVPEKMRPDTTGARTLINETYEELGEAT